MDGDCWRDDEDVAAWSRGAGWRWKERLAGAFGARVVGMTRELGRRPMMWDEALELGDFLGAEAEVVDAERLTVSTWRDWLSDGDAPGGEAWRRAVAAAARARTSSCTCSRLRRPPASR